MKSFEISLLGYAGVSNVFTPAVSNFSLKLRWKCTENASEGSYFLKVIFPAQPWWAAILKREGTGGGPPKVGTKFKIF